LLEFLENTILLLEPMQGRPARSQRFFAWRASNANFTADNVGHRASSWLTDRGSLPLKWNPAILAMASAFASVVTTGF